MAEDEQRESMTSRVPREGKGRGEQRRGGLSRKSGFPLDVDPLRDWSCGTCFLVICTYKREKEREREEANIIFLYNKRGGIDEEFELVRWTIKSAIKPAWITVAGVKSRNFVRRNFNCPSIIPETRPTNLILIAEPSLDGFQSKRISQRDPSSFHGEG